METRKKFSLFVAGWCAASALGDAIDGDFVWAGIMIVCVAVNLALAHEWR